MPNDTAYTPDLKGFYEKYEIRRKNADGTAGEKVEGPTFLLRPYDPHARKALLAYAESVREENPGLASDLESLVAQHA